MLQYEVIDPIEGSVGITQFLNQGQSFQALFKQRYSDFIVNEVTLNKQIVFISDPSKWKDLADVKQSHRGFLDNPDKQLSVNPFADFSLPENFEQQSYEILGEEATKSIIKYINELKFNPNRTNFQVQIPLPILKEDRVKVHNFVRQNLPFMETTTRNFQNQKKAAKETKAQSKTGEKQLDEFILIKLNFVSFKRFKSEKLFGKDDQQKEFLQFTLMKRNFDTINAGILISKFLGISNKHFQMAGIKDKRGITTQRVSLQGITKGQLEEVQSRRNWNQNILLSDYTYSNEPVALGDLYGNRFAITLRLVCEKNLQELEKNIKNVKELGFLNYFGLQRFGVGGKVKTYEIGKALVQQRWKEAVRLIISAISTEDPYVQMQLKDYFDYWDHSALLKALPQKFRLERMIILGLQNQSENNFLNAFMNLPRNARELYIHSFQSLIWNKLASQRVKDFGTKVVVGDLVQIEDNIQNEEDAEGADLIADIEEEQEFNIQYEEKQKQDQIIVVTKENLNQFNLNDVVVPIYGVKSNIPENSIYNKLLDEALKQEGVSKLDFITLGQQFMISGGFRKLICTPEQLDYEIINYQNKESDLISPFYNQKQLQIEQGNKKALIIKFNLKKSAYATMLIREVTKQSSSLELQQQLVHQYNLL